MTGADLSFVRTGDIRAAISGRDTDLLDALGVCRLALVEQFPTSPVRQLNR